MNAPIEFVKRGIDLLFSKSPHWFQKVNLETLAMGSFCNCLIAQCFGFEEKYKSGSYERGLDRIGLPISEAWRYGFDLVSNTGDLNDGIRSQAFDKLTMLWTSAIKHFRAAAGAGDMRQPAEICDEWAAMLLSPSVC
jgi:hypothetical protein